jgi:hypothetical protein
LDTQDVLPNSAFRENIWSDENINSRPFNFGAPAKVHKAEVNVTLAC